ncbi:MAG: nucleotidyltransferase [Acidobacteria bacterium]|nr:nucleotidyltransferase [Acidobacteriota bacterium]
MELQQNQLESASRAQSVLEAAGIQSVVIGGLAIAVWGEPRVTKDVDLRVFLQREQTDLLLSALSTQFKPLSDSPETKLQQQGFIFTEDASGVRVDFLLADNEFDITMVRNGRRIEPISGWPIIVCSAEDLIVSKLITLRPRDEEDARLVIRRQRDNLDDNYVEKWLRAFEQALDDSTLVTHYRQLRQRYH